MDTAQRLDTPRVTPMTRRQVTVLAATVGLITAVATLAVAAVIALFFGLANPLVSVGDLVIDLVPPGVKEFVIDLFGTGDKAFLLSILGLVVAVAAVFVGVLQQRRAPGGIILLLAIALVAVIAALTRANASIADALPTVVGVLVGILLLRAMIARLEAWRIVASRKPQRSRSGVSIVERRTFLQLAIGTAAASVIVGTGAQLLAAGSSAVTAVRKKIRLPAASSPGPVIPASAELHIPGLSPYIVPNSQFYRIDTALQVPSVDPDTWKLTIGGMVENRVELTFAELLKLPLIERLITLTCVSQEIGGNLIGNALWLGYPVRELLARAKPKTGADMVLSTSVDGFTAGSPLAVLQDPGTDAMLAVGMNGQPLPLEHGFPVRMVVPGLYGYVSATKWLVNLKVTTFAKDQGYWTPRGWSAKGPIKLSSRIDTPQDGTSVAAGTVAVAGVAWHQHVGIKGVQVQVDNGPWQDATLATVVSVDTWLQWSFPWEANPGQHQLTVRAIDDSGQVQVAAITDPAPNGSTGLHSIRVTVTG